MKFRDNISINRLAAMSFISIALLVLSPSCFNDDFNKAMKLELFPYEVMVPANNAPVPGGSGLITSVVDNTTVNLSWTAATDVETDQTELEYILYISGSDNIRTPDEAENSGIELERARDMTFATVSSLEPATTYYFNVIVRDGDGNRAAYIMIGVTTLTDEIYMSSVGPFTGDLADPASASVRDDIDSLCTSVTRSSKSYMPPCLKKRAFISISSADDIAGMPRNFGIPTKRRIIGPTGVQIADTWDDLLDGSIDSSLLDAGIVPDQWWSGSTSGGFYDSSVDNCSGWTDVSKQGRAGTQEKTDDTWINGNTPDCNADRYVLCVCW